MAKLASSSRTAASQLPGNGGGDAAVIAIQPQQRNHVLWTVFCITVLGALSIVSGAYLIMHNHESGGTLLISTGGTGTITGLIGLLSMSKGTGPQAPVATADGAKKD
jgi:hypothetical protein